jgi:hypothetical protein
MMIDPWGSVRVEIDDWRCRQMLAEARPPERCGPEMVPAPARGAFATFQPQLVVPIPGEAEGWEVQDSGYRGRDALCQADVFDVMARQARRAGAQEAPFSASQVNVGRTYRDLVERLAAAGVRCSSLEGRAASGRAGGGDWIEAVMRDRAELEAMRRGIGGRVALDPKYRSATRAPITDRQLVDLVCVADRALDEVLRYFGWSLKGEHRHVVRTALRGALDRMQLATGMRGQHVG